MGSELSDTLIASEVRNSFANDEKKNQVERAYKNAITAVSCQTVVIESPSCKHLKNIYFACCDYFCLLTKQ